MGPRRRPIKPAAITRRLGIGDRRLGLAASARAGSGENRLRSGAAKQVALAHLDAEAAQPVDLVVQLDHLGNGLDVEIGAEVAEIAQQQAVPIGAQQAPRVGAIDLHVVDFERAQILKRRSEEHTSELQSLMSISYAVFCLKKK